MATSAPKDAKPARPIRQDPKAREEPAAAQAPRPGKRNAVKFVVLALVLLLAGGGTAWYFVAGATSAPAKPGAKGAKLAAPVASMPPAFLPMDSFTVNLQPENEAQFLQVGLTLKLAGSGYDEAIKARMPEIRNRILLLLSAKKASELTSVEGKQALAEQVQREVMQALGGSVPSGGIAGVLFTSFLIQ